MQAKPVGYEQPAINFHLGETTLREPCGRGWRASNDVRCEPGEGFDPRGKGTTPPHPPSLCSGTLSRKGRGKTPAPPAYTASRLNSHRQIVVLSSRHFHGLAA